MRLSARSACAIYRSTLSGSRRDIRDTVCVKGSRTGRATSGRWRVGPRDRLSTAGRLLNADVCHRAVTYLRSSRNRGQKINPERHAVVCINIGKSMVTRDVGVPPQDGPIGCRSGPHRGELLHLTTRPPACSFRSRQLPRPDARVFERRC